MDTQKEESAAKSAGGGFDRILDNPSPGFDKAFKAFIGLALVGILLAFVQQLGISVPDIPTIEDGGRENVGGRCVISCGAGTLGATIPASCGACPSNTYKDSEYTSGGVRYFQCVCR